MPWNAAVTLERTYERSFNLLEGYRYAHMVARALRSELVYLLEEDVWVARDYFAFHRAAHAHKHLAIGGMPPAVRGPLSAAVSLHRAAAGSDTAVVGLLQNQCC